MSSLAALAARIFGPKLIAAIPWNLVAWLLLIAGVVSSYWVTDDRAYDRGHASGEAAAQPRILHAGVLAGMDVQSAADGRAMLKAFLAADAKQDALVARMAAAQDIISKGATDAIATMDDAAGRALAGFELRHPAPHTDPGRAGKDGPAAATDAASVDARAAALQLGLVAVPADAVADAAVTAGRLVVCQNWATEQAAAYDAVVGPTTP